ncbi:MAG: phage tail assembly protein [Vulcanimicrobiaceae bacterium]
MATTVPLSKPLTTHDGDVSTLTLRDVTAADIVSCKVAPYKFDPNGTTYEINYAAVMALASRLCGLDDLILGKLSAKDFHAVSQAILGLWSAAGE